MSWIRDDDGGFTSLGVVLATAVALLLVFSTSQVVWVNSASADVQYVADAAALAGANVVASYLTVARVVDAAMLSLSLIGILTLVVATVVACIPYVNTLAEPMFKVGRQILSARNKFGDSAAKGLDALQRALPVLLEANALAVVKANGLEGGTSYGGLVVPFPVKGDGIEVGDDTTDVDSIERTGGEASVATQATEEARQAMSDDLEEAFRADCVDAPSSMRGRASSLAGMSGASNPRYASSSGWSFAVPLSRARAYYRNRLQAESESRATVLEEKVKSKAREEFYRVALETITAGFAPSAGDLGKGLDVPRIPRNTEEMRATSAYSRTAYPTSEGVAGVSVLHFSEECPAYGLARSTSAGTLRALDEGLLAQCDTCRFDISRVGAVPSASTNINNGFEHYYRIVALAAERYEEHSAQYRATEGKARELAEGSKDLFAEALKKISGRRFDPHPAGMHGCVAMVVDPESRRVPKGLRSDAELPPRAAVSAAALASQAPDVGSTLLSGVFDGLVSKADRSSSRSGSGGFAGLAWLIDSLFGAWGDALYAYLRGSQALEKGIKDTLDSVPGFEEAGISDWASGFVEDIVAASGLAPAKVDMVRPLLVNSSHVLATDSSVGGTLADAQRRYASASTGSGDSVSELRGVLDSLVGELETFGADALSGEHTVATVDLFGVVRVPVTATLPEAVVTAGKEALASGRSRVNSVFAGVTSGEKEWEAWR